MCEAHVGKLFLPLKEMVCFNKFLGSGDCVNSLLDGVMASRTVLALDVLHQHTSMSSQFVQVC
jgi:hypothetical protein